MESCRILASSSLLSAAQLMLANYTKHITKTLLISPNSGAAGCGWVSQWLQWVVVYNFKLHLIIVHSTTNLSALYTFIERSPLRIMKIQRTYSIRINLLYKLFSSVVQ